MGTKLWVFFSIIATVLVTTAVISYGPGIYKMSEDFVCAPFKNDNSVYETMIAQLERKLYSVENRLDRFKYSFLFLIFNYQNDIITCVLLCLAILLGCLIILLHNVTPFWESQNILVMPFKFLLMSFLFKKFKKNDTWYIWNEMLVFQRFKVICVDKFQKIELSQEKIDKFLTPEEIKKATRGFPTEDDMRALFVPEVSEDLKKLMFAVGTPEDEQIGVVVKNDSHILVAIKRGEYVDRMKSFPELDETKMFKMLAEAEKPEEFETFVDLQEILGN